MTAQSRTRPAGNGTGSEDQVGAGSLPTLQPTTVTNASDTATRCRVCHRRLMLPRSAAAGIGHRCADRIAASLTLPGWRVETVVAAAHGAVIIALLPAVVAP